MNEERDSFSQGPTAVFSKLFARGTLFTWKNNHGSPQPCPRKYGVSGSQVARIKNYMS